jgi:hypothetical protein
VTSAPARASCFIAAVWAITPSRAIAEPAAPYALHTGLTVEGNLGITLAHVNAANTADQDGPYDSDRQPGFGVAVGWWLTPRLAITARYEELFVKNSSARNFTYWVLGPHVQYWLEPRFWIGGGLGVARWSSDGMDAGDNGSGVGVDLRAGYAFGSTRHTFNVSVEITPGWLDIDNGDGTTSRGTVTGVALLAGYQYL